MRLKATTLGVLTAGALTAAMPAIATASTSGAARTSNTPSATPSQFQQVQVGQTIAQVRQEMGSGGSVDQMGPEHHAPQLTQEVVDWNDSALGPLGGTIQFSVDFAQSAAGRPLTVTGKTALGLNTQSVVGLTN